MKRASLLLVLVLSGVVLGAAPVAAVERKVLKPVPPQHGLLCGTPLLKPLLPFVLFGRIL